MMSIGAGPGRRRLQLTVKGGYGDGICALRTDRGQGLRLFEEGETGGVKAVEHEPSLRPGPPRCQQKKGPGMIRDLF